MSSKYSKIVYNKAKREYGLSYSHVINMINDVDFRNLNTEELLCIENTNKKYFISFDSIINNSRNKLTVAESVDLVPTSEDKIPEEENNNPVSASLIRDNDNESREFGVMFTSYASFLSHFRISLSDKCSSETLKFPVRILPNEAIFIAPRACLSILPLSDLLLLVPRSKLFIHQVGPLMNLGHEVDPANSVLKSTQIVDSISCDYIRLICSASTGATTVVNSLHGSDGSSDLDGSGSGSSTQSTECNESLKSKKSKNDNKEKKLTIPPNRRRVLNPKISVAPFFKENWAALSKYQKKHNVELNFNEPESVFELMGKATGTWSALYRENNDKIPAYYKRSEGVSIYYIEYSKSKWVEGIDYFRSLDDAMNFIQDQVKLINSSNDDSDNSS